MHYYGLLRRRSCQLFILWYALFLRFKPRAISNDSHVLPRLTRDFYRHLRFRHRVQNSARGGQPHFSCVDAHAVRAPRILKSFSRRKSIRGDRQTDTGPEPPYARPTYYKYHYLHPLPLTYPSTYSI